MIYYRPPRYDANRLAIIDFRFTLLFIIIILSYNSKLIFVFTLYHVFIRVKYSDRLSGFCFLVTYSSTLLVKCSASSVALTLKAIVMRRQQKGIDTGRTPRKNHPTQKQHCVNWPPYCCCWYFSGMRADLIHSQCSSGGSNMSVIVSEMYHVLRRVVLVT